VDQLVIEREPDLKDPTIPSAPLVPNFRMDGDTIPCPPPFDCDEDEGEQVS
jgi:hypothetical protein